MVEDEVSLIQTLMEILVIQGHQVHLSMNGLEALELLRKIKPDIIIADIVMPEMGGLELLRKLKKSEGTALIPFVFLSAKTETLDKLAGLEVGADAYLTKPFKSLELLSTIERVVNRRHEFSVNLLSSPQMNTPAAGDEKFLRKLNTILEDTLSKKMNIGEVALLLNMSESGFQQKIKKISNNSAGAYIKQFKLLRAKELLDRKAGTISEIARLAGFDNLAYFSSSFKNQFGYGPSKKHQ